MTELRGNYHLLPTYARWQYTSTSRQQLQSVLGSYYSSF